MLIKMKTTAGGSDGNSFRFYEEGETYDIAESLGCHFVNRGYADCVPQDKPDDKYFQMMKEAIKRYDARILTRLPEVPVREIILENPVTGER